MLFTDDVHEKLSAAFHVAQQTEEDQVVYTAYGAWSITYVAGDDDEVERFALVTSAEFVWAQDKPRQFNDVWIDDGEHIDGFIANMLEQWVKELPVEQKLEIAHAQLPKRGPARVRNGQGKPQS